MRALLERVQSMGSKHRNKAAGKQNRRQTGCLQLEQAALEKAGKDASRTLRPQDETAKPEVSSHTGLQRFLAWTGLLLILLLLLALFYTLITGGSTGQLLAILFCLMVIPCMLYAFQLYLRYTVQQKRDRK